MYRLFIRLWEWINRYDTQHIDDLLWEIEAKAHTFGTFAGGPMPWPELARNVTVLRADCSEGKRWVAQQAADALTEAGFNVLYSGTLDDILDEEDEDYVP